MRVVGKTKALGALAGIPRACNEGGSAQRVTPGTKVSTAARRRAMSAAGVLHVAGGPFGWLDVAEQWRRLEWEL